MSTHASGRRAPRVRVGRPHGILDRGLRGVVSDRRAVPAILALTCFAVSFAQRPGRAAFDSRIELAVNPSLFLHRVASVWSATNDLGHVQSAQFVGYAFPMAPWFALTHAIGLPTWVAERIWLGAVMALAAWGVVRLLDAMYSSRRGPAHLAAGALFAFSPYVAVYTSQGTIPLVSYAALPWAMLIALRGLDEPHRWRRPATLGILVTVAGGGVNAAVAAWMLLAPALLIFYEWAVLRRRGREIVAFSGRAFVCVLAGSLWWAVPVLLQARYGADFLSFTELPTSIWATTSLSESMRLLGFWVTYLGVGSQPVMAISRTYLFDPAVIAAGFAIPAFAFVGLRRTRGWAYAPLFGLVTVCGLLVMFAGFPEGTPLRRLLYSLYYSDGSIRFLRTPYKAAPLVALGLACLAAIAVDVLIRELRAGRVRAFGRRLPAWSALALLAIPVLNGLPLFTGRAIDKPLAYGSVPSYWKRSVADAARSTPTDHRIMVLPGLLFGHYRWGNTVTPIAPALTKRPVLAREVVRYADPRSSQLQTVVDDLIQQGRLVPGQLQPLLELMGVGQVLLASDQGAGSEAADPETIAQSLRGQLPSAAQTYGQSRTYGPPQGRGGDLVQLPDMQRFTFPGTAAPGIVRVQAQQGAVLLDGDASGITELAAQGQLQSSRALIYAGDASQKLVTGAVGAGATLVFSDSNRRRVIEGNRLQDNLGPTMGPDDPFPHDWPSYDLFPSRGSDAQTVALYSGLSYLRSPPERGFSLLPEHRAYAALDGDLATSWVAGSTSTPSRRYFELGFPRPRDIGAVDVYPLKDSLGLTNQIAISLNGGPAKRFRLKAGWNRLTLDGRAVRSLRVTVVGTTSLFGGSGGISELRVPGLSVRESLRLPRTLANETRGLDLSRNPVEVVLSRTTADFPGRAGKDVANADSGSAISMVDAEPGLERDVTLPVARQFSLQGWASLSPAVPDDEIDRLTGMPRGWRFTSSSRFEGLAINRASSAFDGSPQPWIGDLLPGQPAPWLAWQAPRPIRVSELRLHPGPAGYDFPFFVRISAPGYSKQLPVDQRTGVVRLRRTIETRSMKISFLLAGPTGGPLGAARLLEAVAISEVEIRGLRPPVPRRAGDFATPCGAATVKTAGSSATVRVSGTVQALDNGEPLRISACRGPAELGIPAGDSHVSVTPGPLMRIDHLLLLSRPPALGHEAAGGGRVAFVGSGGSDERRGIRVDVAGPSWLVLGESYSRGWRAWCSDASGHERALGAATPVDGYANGWQVGSWCRVARVAFAPQRTARLFYLLGGGAALLMAGMVLAGFAIRRGATGPHAPPAWASATALDLRLSPSKAARAAVVTGVVCGFLFGMRVGAAVIPLTLAIFIIGATVDWLLAVAGLAVTTMAVLYILNPAPNFNGFSFSYPVHFIGAHWLGVAALISVSLVCVRVAVERRRLSRPGA